MIVLISFQAIFFKWTVNFFKLINEYQIYSNIKFFTCKQLFIRIFSFKTYLLFFLLHYNFLFSFEVLGIL